MTIICAFYPEDEFLEEEIMDIYIHICGGRNSVNLTLQRRYYGIIEAKNNNGLMYMYFTNRKERSMNDLRLTEFSINLSYKVNPTRS